MTTRQGPRTYTGTNPICLRGHDKRVTGVYGTSCAACSHEYAVQRAASAAAAWARSGKTRPTAQGIRYVELSPAKAVAVMDLRQKAETAMPWERVELLAEAQRIAAGGA